MTLNERVAAALISGPWDGASELVRHRAQHAAERILATLEAQDALSELEGQPKSKPGAITATAFYPVHFSSRA